MIYKVCEILLVNIILGIARADLPLSLSKPSFESEWQAIAAQDPNMTTLSIPHNLGEYPVKVDVQIKVTTNDKEYIFTGIGSAHRDDDIDKYYGGTVYVYNEHEIILTFPIKNNEVDIGGIAYTGSQELYKGPEEIEGPYYKGFVKVRAWLGSDLPPPVINMSVDISNEKNYKEVVHTLGLYPDIVSVQILLETGYISDAQGTVLEGTCNYACDRGGVVFGYDKEKIYIWASQRGVFSATDGWGLEQSYQKGNVSILGWTTDDCNKVFNETFTVRKGANITHSLTFRREYDFSSYFVSVQVKVPNIHNSNVSIVFNAIGSSMASGVPTFGGIVYVYTEESILFWTPSTSNGHLVYVGDVWGSGQNEQISDIADVYITVYYVGDKSTPTITTENDMSTSATEIDTTTTGNEISSSPNTTKMDKPTPTITTENDMSTNATEIDTTTTGNEISSSPITTKMGTHTTTATTSSSITTETIGVIVGAGCSFVVIVAVFGFVYYKIRSRSSVNIRYHDEDRGCTESATMPENNENVKMAELGNQSPL